MIGIPTMSDIGLAIGLGASAVGTALILWIRSSKAKLEVQENASQGGWITNLIKRAEEAELRERAAELRERATYALHRADQEKIAELTTRITIAMEKMDRQGKQIALITKLLVDSDHPLANVLLSSGFGELFGERP